MKSLFCDSLHVKYHLQWNVLSINQSDIPLSFVDVTCNFSHLRNKVF